MRLLLLLLLVSSTVYCQTKLISDGLTNPYKDPTIKEKYYISPPNILFNVPLTTDLSRHFISYVSPTLIGWNGIRYFQDTNMYTFRALYSGLSASLAYVYGKRSPGVSSNALTSIGVLDKKLPKNIDRYNKALFTNLSFKENIYDSQSFKTIFSKEDTLLIARDLYEREQRILEQFKKLPEFS